jgi:hypothetical protein
VDFAPVAAQVLDCSPEDYWPVPVFVLVVLLVARLGLREAYPLELLDLT